MTYLPERPAALGFAGVGCRITRACHWRAEALKRSGATRPLSRHSSRSGRNRPKQRNSSGCRWATHACVASRGSCHSLVLRKRGQTRVGQIELGAIGSILHVVSSAPGLYVRQRRRMSKSGKPFAQRHSHARVDGDVAAGRVVGVIWYSESPRRLEGTSATRGLQGNERCSR